MQDHQLDQDKVVTPQLVRMSAETGIPLVATNDSHYLRKEDARAHEILMCIQTGKTMSDPNRMRFSHPEFYMKSRAEMMALFGEIPDAVDRPVGHRPALPRQAARRSKIPSPIFRYPTQHTTDSYFEHVAREGFEKRRSRLEAMAARGTLKCHVEDYAERLDFEIKMIQQMKFSGYFLIVWDFIRFARSMNIPVGPGSGLRRRFAGFLRHGNYRYRSSPIRSMLFERFLNPERVSMPDIDIDFCMNRRGEVIQYVTQKVRS